MNADKEGELIIEYHLKKSLKSQLSLIGTRIGDHKKLTSSPLCDAHYQVRSSRLSAQFVQQLFKLFLARGGMHDILVRSY